MRGEFPKSLKVVRVLLYVFAAITALTVLGGFLVAGVSPTSVGALLYVALPGIFAFVLARRLPRGGGGVFWGTVVLQAFLILISFGRLGGGEIQGLTTMVLPVLILVFLLRKPSREYLRG